MFEMQSLDASPDIYAARVGTSDNIPPSLHEDEGEDVPLLTRKNETERWWQESKEWKVRRRSRLVLRGYFGDAQLNARLVGIPWTRGYFDLYHKLLDVKWWKLLLLLCAFYFTSHIFFGLLY